jgi:hypothetical protein
MLMMAARCEYGKEDSISFGGYESWTAESSHLTLRDPTHVALAAHLQITMIPFHTLLPAPCFLYTCLLARRSSVLVQC